MTIQKLIFVIVDDASDASDASGSFAEDESGEDWDELEKKAARG